MIVDTEQLKEDMESLEEELTYLIKRSKRQQKDINKFRKELTKLEEDIK